MDVVFAEACLEGIEVILMDSAQPADPD